MRMLVCNPLSAWQGVVGVCAACNRLHKLSAHDQPSKKARTLQPEGTKIVERCSASCWLLTWAASCLKQCPVPLQPETTSFDCWVMQGPVLLKGVCRSWDANRKSRQKIWEQSGSIGRRLQHQWTGHGLLQGSKVVLLPPTPPDPRKYAGCASELRAESCPVTQ